MKLARIKTFLVRNRGAIFIIAFMALILTCASLMVERQPRVEIDPLIETVAVIGYCSLIIGIVLEAWDFAKQKALGGAFS